jgi:two-component system chemotaxis response regulator CheB
MDPLLTNATEHAAADDFRVVALVASAGGVDAVSRVLEGLPEDLGAAVVVLIHQRPDRISRLAEILSRHCVLPVVAAENDTPLLPSRVVVVPPGKHLLVLPSARTSLIISGGIPPSRPSADLLLATLATGLGPRVIAVILSGFGHNGATGATAVHACGGTVVATDEASSAQFSMPRAAIERDEAVDRVVPLGEVAELITGLVAAEAAPGRG